MHNSFVQPAMSEYDPYPYYNEAACPKALLGGGEEAAYVILRQGGLNAPIRVGWGDQWEEVPLTVEAVRELARVVEKWAAAGLV